MKTQIVNLRKDKYDVYIGRASLGSDGYFGNPFTIKDHGPSALGMYAGYFEHKMKTDPEFKRRIEALRGKVLGCFCKPNRCHGDVIVQYLEATT